MVADWGADSRSLAKMELAGQLEPVLATVLRMQMTLLTGSEYSLWGNNGSKLLVSSYYIYVCVCVLSVWTM